MNNTWLILDADYLCHRAKYSTGDLAFQGKATGVIFGVLKYVLSLQEQFRTNRVIWCWDSRQSKRKKMYPKYKANRHKKELTPKEKRFEKQFHRQMRLLRKKYLKMIGYQNVFHQKGYEADDLIASVRQFLRIMRTSQNIIIVSADHDLYQLIDSEVSVFHPREERTVTLQSFTKMFGIRPAVWPMVKAIGGCATDNIKGIKGVGEKTAIRLVRNKLPKTSKVVKRHLSNKGKKIIARNLQLVCLPFPGTKSVKLRHNKLSQQGWRKVCRILGFSSLRDKAFPKVPD